MNKLLSKLQKASSIVSMPLSESKAFNEEEMVKTDLPILNIAFSADPDGGMLPGLTVFAGESKSFKTLLGLYCIKSYLDKYEDAVCLFYDSEYGTPPSYVQNFGIDSDRILHTPVTNIEELKFDVMKKLEAIEDGDRIIIFVDSLGGLASKKEVDDAIEEKSVADMTRAKSIRSLIRMITPHLTLKKIPCILINHIYQTMEMYSKSVIGGGTSVMYGANQAFIITKAQEKDKTTKELLGWNFTINIEKSRFVRERAKFPFTVAYKSGIKKWSGLFEIALAGGFIKNPKQGWYTTDGENNRRKADIEKDSEYWKGMLTNDEFKSYIKSSYESTGVLLEAPEEE